MRVTLREVSRASQVLNAKKPPCNWGVFRDKRTLFMRPAPSFVPPSPSSSFLLDGFRTLHVDDRIFLSQCDFSRLLYPKCSTTLIRKET